LLLGWMSVVEIALDGVGFADLLVVRLDRGKQVLLVRPSCQQEMRCPKPPKGAVAELITCPPPALRELSARTAPNVMDLDIRKCVHGALLKEPVI